MHPTARDSSSLQRRANTLFCFHLCTHSRLATLRPDNHNGRDGIGPSSGRNKGEKTGSYKMDILTTLFRSVASRARTLRHLSARISITTGPCTPRLPQHAAASSGQALIRADLEGRVSRLGWRPDWPRLSGMPQQYQRNLFQSNGPEMSLAFSNAKGSCHCNLRFPFMRFRTHLRWTARFFSPSEGSPIATQLRFWLFRNMATKDKRPEKWTQPDRVYRLFPPAPKHQNIVLHLALRSLFYWSRGTATETVASPPKTIHD